MTRCGGCNLFLEKKSLENGAGYTEESEFQRWKYVALRMSLLCVTCHLLTYIQLPPDGSLLGFQPLASLRNPQKTIGPK